MRRRERSRSRSWPPSSARFSFGSRVGSRPAGNWSISRRHASCALVSHPGGAMKTITCAALVALAGFGAARAEGQITTVVEQPKRVEAKAQAVARRQEVAQD